MKTVKHWVFSYSKILFSLQALLLLLFTSCATYGEQLGKELKSIHKETESTEKSFKFFLIGDAGNSGNSSGENTLNQLKSQLNQADENSMLIVLGDNVYPFGIPEKDDENYEFAKNKLLNQLKITQNFKGKILVIPGNHDWYNDLRGLKDQETIVNDFLNDKKAFQPQNGCPLEEISVTDKVTVLAIDSEWYITDWDKNYGINKNCSIKTRENFLSELKDKLEDNQDKTVIIAMHHPILTGGEHGGFNSLKTHIFPLRSNVPLPGVGTALNVLRKSSGIADVDLSNVHYAELALRLRNLLQDKENVIVVSGHEHNLQYAEEGKIRQLISGAGSKVHPSTIVEKTDYSYGGNGFAVLNVDERGRSSVDFYSTEPGKERPLKSIVVREISDQKFTPQQKTLPKTVSATVYPEKLTDRGFVQNFLFGKKYRSSYATSVEAPVADLSKLKGGLQPIGEGGSDAKNNLILENNESQLFELEPLAKNPSKFLQNVVFRRNSFGNSFENTFTERQLLDFYTSSHPFAAIPAERLAQKLNISTEKSQLYFVPKQHHLGKYNQQFGDQFYLFKEKITDHPLSLSNFGNPHHFETTQNVIQNLHDPQQFSIDEKAYIRARLLDILLGDWNRNHENWKWAAHKKGEKIEYQPISLDHDDAFSKYGGNLLPFILSTPQIRHLKTFNHKIKNIRWLNREAYPLDLVFAKNSGKEDWLQEAEFISENMTDNDIEAAFTSIPNPAQDETIEEIKSKLKQRRNDLALYAEEYYQILQEKVIVTGTNEEDIFEIQKSKNSVKLSHFITGNSGGKKLIGEKEILGTQTKELWIYGLNGNDKFHVSGSENPGLKIRLIGGYDDDSYEVVNGNSTKIYDFKSEKNSIKGNTARKISPHYNTNMYDYRKPTYNFFIGLPMLNYNPDDGVQLLYDPTITVNNFIREPYSQKHKLKLGYYTATGAISAVYKGIIKRAVGSFDIELDGAYNTPTYTQNFFGLSNESGYDKELFKNDFNRVRREKIYFAPSLSRTGWMNFTHQFQIGFESNKIEKNTDRIVATSGDVNPEVFERQNFGHINYNFSYQNVAEKYFPVFGMGVFMNSGWKTSLTNSEKNFFEVRGTFNFTHRIDKKGHLVFANSTDATWLSNNNFEFYQAASVGGDQNLRSYRNNRFSGRYALANSSDVRVNFGKIRNGLAPANFGIFGGYDIGRVWNDNEKSRKWHQSYGGGIWISLVENFTGRLQYFTGEDGGRISGGLGFVF